ncbi:Hypothetical predicted protein, partial [Marmota monax]
VQLLITWKEERYEGKSFLLANSDPYPGALPPPGLLSAVLADIVGLRRPGIQ